MIFAIPLFPQHFLTSPRQQKIHLIYQHLLTSQSRPATKWMLSSIISYKELLHVKSMQMRIYKQKKIDPDAKKYFKMLPALSPPTARTSSSENS